MSSLKNPRHECFAQELAKGISKAEAYANAGYKGGRSCACRQSTKANIRSRVTELQADAAVNTVVTIEQLTYELEEARRLATARGNASAAVLAIVAKARLHGLLNRDQAPLPNTIVEATAERQQSPREIARLIAFALAIGRQQRLAGKE
jgi:4-hydroxy-3-methylbut-2-enyl diphosphate reductase IspH